MCRSARRRGSVHRAHPHNHGDAEHPAEGDGGGFLRTRRAPVKEVRPSWRDAPPTVRVATVVEDAGNAILRQTLDGATMNQPGDQPATREEEIEVSRRCLVRMAEQLGREPAHAAPTKRSPSGCAAGRPGGGGGETRTERCGRTPESQRTQAPPSRAPAYPNRTIADRRGPAPPTQRGEWRCYTCGQTGDLARHCPGAGDVSMPTASPSDRKGGVCLRTTCRPAYVATHPAPSRSDSEESPDRPPREAGWQTHASSTVSLPLGTPDTMTASERAPPPDGGGA
ncbi:unnamed protein product [Boreogadus saida]